MPEAPETVNLVDREGRTYAVPANQVGELLARDFALESPDQAAARVSQAAKEEAFGGVGGGVTAGTASALDALTLGGFSGGVSLLGGGERLKGFYEVNPVERTIGTIGGTIAASIAAPGSLLAHTPAGAISRLGARVAGIGEGAGLATRAGFAAGGAALEGAAQNAGAYISDVALGNKELSADAFTGAMGKGALWGGVAGGALTVAASGLTAARRLFPRQEVTSEAVQAAEETARRSISTAIDEGDSLAQAAKDRLRVLRAEAAAQDLQTKVKLDDIAVKKAQELSDAQIARAQAQSELAQVRLEKAKAGPGKRVRKALQEEVEAPIPSVAAQPEAVAAGAVEDTTTLLERQLAGTKQGLEAGETLASLAARRPTAIGLKPTHVEDALNAEIAKTNPEAARLVKGLAELESGKDAMSTWLAKYPQGKVARKEAVETFAEGLRKKEGYVSRVPAGEGTVGLPRGRQFEWRGTEEARSLEDAVTMGKVSPEERLAADDAIAEMFARQERRSIGREIAEGKPPPTIDEQVQTAVRSKVDSIDDDIAESADAINRLEAASAELTDVLGPAAPAGAQVKAKAFREAQQGAERATRDASARLTADVDRAAQTIGLGVPSPGGGRLGNVAERLQDIGTMGEALRMLGIDVPDPRNIPVIGPLLGEYLKARVMSKVWGRFGGKIANTAETTIASKAAQVKQRIYAAVDKMADVSSKAMAKAAGRAGGPAAALGHVLFDDKEPKAKPYTSQAPKGSLAATYLARADEVTRAMRPGAIEESVRARIKTSDPVILDAIVAAQTRKLDFLSQKMPRPNQPPLPTQVHIPWVPSKAEIAQWGRYVQAAEDPAAVIETAANDGYVSLEAVETLKTVYPQLYAEAQSRILARSMDQTKPLPYSRRVQLSVLFDMPFDGSQTPEGAQFLQSTYTPPPPTPQPQAPTQTPTVTADVRMSERTDPSTKI